MTGNPTMIRFAKAHAYGNDFLYVEQAGVAGADAAGARAPHVRAATPASAPTA